MFAIRNRSLLAVLAAVVLSGFVASQADDKKAVPKVKREIKLFNGKNLDGWKNSMFGGDGEIGVEDGQLILDMGNDITGVTWKDEKAAAEGQLRNFVGGSTSRWQRLLLRTDVPD